MTAPIEYYCPFCAEIHPRSVLCPTMRGAVVEIVQQVHAEGSRVAAERSRANQFQAELRHTIHERDCAMREIADQHIEMWKQRQALDVAQVTIYDLIAAHDAGERDRAALDELAAGMVNHDGTGSWSIFGWGVTTKVADILKRTGRLK